MSLNEDQKRALLTNLARDKAEHLKKRIAQAFAEARAQDRPDLSEEDRKRGEYAMQRALESAERMVKNLEEALKLAEQMAEAPAEGADDADSEQIDIDPRQN